ncbi:MAG: macro domain-containing protein [Deltaproteobacteria bacterium]|nr:macro domain-containing protein [Deltaproteobacteria bacterium]
MLPTKILLVDRTAELVDAWRASFAGVSSVSAHHGDFFARPANAMVSPANSFGFMDGGLDLAIRDRLGAQVQANVQAAIEDQFHGELPVGMAVVVESGVKDWPYVVAAPTMRVPENVNHMLNAYLAFRAILLAVRRFNLDAGRAVIQSVVCPGLGTGIGALEPERCATQMKMALDSVARGPAVPSIPEIHPLHRALRSS